MLCRISVVVYRFCVVRLCCVLCLLFCPTQRRAFAINLNLIFLSKSMFANFSFRISSSRFVFFVISSILALCSLTFPQNLVTQELQFLSWWHWWDQCRICRSFDCGACVVLLSCFIIIGNIDSDNCIGGCCVSDYWIAACGGKLDSSSSSSI